MGLRLGICRVCALFRKLLRTSRQTERQWPLLSYVSIVQREYNAIHPLLPLVVKLLRRQLLGHPTGRGQPIRFDEWARGQPKFMSSVGAILNNWIGAVHPNSFRRTSFRPVRTHCIPQSMQSVTFLTNFHFSSDHTTRRGCRKKDIESKDRNRLQFSSISDQADLGLFGHA